jgi:hypothetical protein
MSPRPPVIRPRQMPDKIKCYSKSGCTFKALCDLRAECQNYELAKQSRFHPDDMPHPDRYEDTIIEDVPEDIQVKPPANPEPIYCVFSPGDGEGFQIGRIIDVSSSFYRVETISGKEKFINIVYPNQVATIGKNYVLLKTNMDAAKALEKELRVAWQFAIEHARRIEVNMLTRVWTRVRGGLV